jgi:fucose permease
MSVEPRASSTDRLELDLERDAVTRLAYLMFGLWGFLLYSLGPALPALRADLDVSRAIASLHTTLVALGFVAVGLAGDRIVGRAGRRRAFWAATAGAGAGAAILAVGTALPVTFAGAAVMGLSGGLLALLVPAILADRHGRLSTAALSEANAAATGFGAAAPFVIALAILAGADWRAPVLAVALVALPLVSAAHRSVAFPGPHEVRWGGGSGRGLPRAYWCRWVALVFFVSAEFCIAFWSTDYLDAEVDLGRAGAAGFASLFLAGIALARLAGGRLGRTAEPERLLPGALLIAVAGFLLFWLPRWPLLSVPALAVTGLGIGLLYPVTIALALASVAGRSDAASARAALGSGVAIALAPFVLASLADGVGLVLAYGMVPALLLGGWLASLVATRVRDGA